MTSHPHAPPRALLLLSMASLDVALHHWLLPPPPPTSALGLDAALKLQNAIMQALGLSFPNWLIPEENMCPSPLLTNRSGMTITIKHQRSKSAPDHGKASFASWDSSLKSLKEVSRDESKARMSKMQGVRKDKRASLKQDVEHLQVMLNGQKATKGLLEQALAQPSSVFIPMDRGHHLSQHTQSLIKDIALLELEVSHLEQLLLSMYRDAFEVKIKEQSCVSKVLNREEPVLKKEELSSRPIARSHQLYTPPKAAKNYLPRSFHTKSGSLVSRILNSPFGSRSFDESKSELKVPRKATSSASFSQPISFSKKESKGSPSAVTRELWREVISAEANGSSIANEASLGVQDGLAPNKLSEELVRCMAAIYCKLADPPISSLGTTITPSSSCSSGSTISSRDLCSSDGWSPLQKAKPSCTVNPSSTCQKETIADLTNPYTSMVAVHWVCVDGDRLQYAEKMLTNFRSLVQELERLDPGELKHEEKLAFWLNIYNALMMHAYLAYGIPRTQIKRISLLQKASYKIGLHSINAHTIENTILGCRSHRPSQWIQALLSPVTKLRTVHHRQAYAIDRPEPLSYFALCCGGHSDPPVRVYTAKNVYQELDVAKKEFLHINLTLRKDSKILAPKVLESFAKESSMGSLSLLEWICQNLSEKQRRDVRACMSMRPYNRCIEWVPYNFSFRYLFVRDLARWFPPISSQ
ncbi:hypothetical protein GOP47_0028061 [Adiantum capillus-veneris]|nr:hypothetical protein GOP47_0028061 [Adiantum capillus-veneris]